MEAEDFFFVDSFDKYAVMAYSRQKLNFSLDIDDNPGFFKAYDTLYNFILKRFDFDIKKEGLYLPEQIHRNRVVRVKPSRFKVVRNDIFLIYLAPEADGLITGLPKRPICILSADCLPIFIYDPIKGIIGIAHAGWKGTHLHIAEVIVGLMVRECGSDPKLLKVVLGPSIRSCCYNVDDERAGLYEQHSRFQNGRYFLDIVSANIAQLKDNGIRSENIIDSRICTYCNSKDFFSYRKQGSRCGRMLSLIFKI